MAQSNQDKLNDIDNLYKAKEQESLPLNTKKKFDVEVTHFNCYSKKFVVETTDALNAQAIVREKVNTLPLDQRKGTYEGADLVLLIKENPQAEYEPKRWFEPTGFAICRQRTERESITPTELVLQKSVGNVMRRLRENMKLSQMEFAIMANLNRALVGVYERGETGIRLFNFINVAAALGKAPDDLMRAVGKEYESMIDQNTPT